MIKKLKGCECEMCVNKKGLTFAKPFLYKFNISSNLEVTNYCNNASIASV